MSQTTYPLGLPDELLDQIKDTAKETGLSAADVMRQAIKFGIPKVRQAMSLEEDIPAEAISQMVADLGPAPEVNYDKVEKR